MGFYIPIIRIPSLKVGWPSPTKLDFWPWYRCLPTYQLRPDSDGSFIANMRRGFWNHQIGMRETIWGKSLAKKLVSRFSGFFGDEKWHSCYGCFSKIVFSKRHYIYFQVEVWKGRKKIRLILITILPLGPWDINLHEIHWNPKCYGQDPKISKVDGFFCVKPRYTSAGTTLDSRWVFWGRRKGDKKSPGILIPFTVTVGDLISLGDLGFLQLFVWVSRLSFRVPCFESFSMYRSHSNAYSWDQIQFAADSSFLWTKKTARHVTIEFKRCCFCVRGNNPKKQPQKTLWKMDFPRQRAMWRDHLDRNESGQFCHVVNGKTPKKTVGGWEGL